MLQVLWNINAAGVASITSWTLTMPQNLVKSMISNPENQGKQMKIIPTFKKIYREHGIMRFYQGYLPTITRGYLVNIITMPLCEAILRRINTENE
jgi:hypothetical protein